MPTHAINIAMLVLLCLLPSLNSVSQGQEKLTGLFQVAVKSKNPKSVPDQATVIAIDQSEDKLFVVDLHHPATLLIGSRRGNEFEIPLDLLTVEGKAIRMTLKGTYVEKKVEGSISYKDFKASWASKSTSSAWYCGNHDPAHVAYTTQEVADATQKHGCKGWRQIMASEVPDFIKSKKDKKK